ncbi:hypothetical protein SVAN01_09912 [Stagonosporopsis vannaccii]|nr:hypothetical protein SVAN01_09912 [Stagonosporopsis vannaccii]
MEQPSPRLPININPDSSVTTPITPIFPTAPDPVEYTEIQIARHHVNASRDLTQSLVIKLIDIHERLSSDQGFEKEENNMAALRRWADDIQNIASEISRKAARLVDDVDYLVFRLKDEEDQDKEVGGGAGTMKVGGGREKDRETRR